MLYEKHGVLCRHGRQDQFWLTVLLCALTAALIFLPFVLIDGGFFHYAGDFNSQQISFYRYMNGFVKGSGYPDAVSENLMNALPHKTFSWATDLGSGVMNAYSFYLYGSPFFWLSLLLPQAWLPYSMAPLLVLKFAAAGGGAYLWLRRYVYNGSFAVIGACLYAFSGFGIYNIFFNHFIDVLALFPWLLWALDECIYHERRGLFAALVALNLLNNYFFFVGQVIFLLIYFVCKCAAGEIRLTLRLFTILAFESLLGVALGSWQLWPAVYSLLQNPRTVDLSSGWGFLTYSKVQQYLAILLSWFMPPDSPYITSIWSEGVVKWTSMTAYLPLCSLAGVLAYWQSRRSSSKKRIAAVCAVCALVPVLNSLFYALNASYYARWYYMPVLILCAMTAAAWEDPAADLESPARTLTKLMWITLVFALVPARDSRTETWSLGVLENPAQYFCMLGFGLAGLRIYRRLCALRHDRVKFARQMLAAVLAFSCVFGIVHIGIGKFGQWETDSGLAAQYTAALQLKEELPEGDYRVDTYKTYDNLGLWLDKSCLQYFGSTAAPSILDFYPSLGVKRDVSSKPELENYALRGLLGVKYMIMDEGSRETFEEEADEGWVYYDTRAGFALYENRNFVPFGTVYDRYTTQEEFDLTARSTRSNLLLRMLVLEEADAEALAPYLTRAEEDDLRGMSYGTYAWDCAARRENACTEFTMHNAGFSARIALEQPRVILFPVPHDDGFAAYVNGAETEIYRVDNGLMAIVCPAGDSHIDFLYRPVGQSLGRKLTFGGLAVWLVYVGAVIWMKKKEKNEQ